ncbi:MAG: DUF1934 domain-containing protein, partial [Ruminococcus sp.]|nr:DUF1934 domain-containing protein [Ruminococcus sp.]
MENNVMISLTSIQYQDDEKSETELLTKASFTQFGEAYIISYEDTETTGFEGSITTITIYKNESASIVRKGTANSVLSLETGKKHYCQYDTPYGSMQIGIYTHKIENDIAKNGKLYLKYTLDLNSLYLSDNEI